LWLDKKTVSAARLTNSTLSAPCLTLQEPG
jgi:hypothetical protein